LATRAEAILLLATRSLPLGGLTVFDSILWMRGTDGRRRFRWPLTGFRPGSALSAGRGSCALRRARWRARSGVGSETGG
jgi:hypothetical protein